MAVVYQENMGLYEKLRILSDSAKYDVACTSSGVSRKGADSMVGNTAACGICHSFSADGRCISLLKILLTNECIYECKYCVNRSSNDVVRTSFTPEEVCTLTMEFYRRNYIEGLFLSSGIRHSPNLTMEQMVKTLRLLRETYHFNGYIHCKAIPGAGEDLVEMAGWYADRMSVNLELVTAEGLKHLAPHKNRKNILMPMRKIQNGIDEGRQMLGACGGNKGMYWHTQRELSDRAGKEKQKSDAGLLGQEVDSGGNLTFSKQGGALSFSPAQTGQRGFVPAGQSTQIIIGATPETDFEVMSVVEALYQRFDLKRVFYSAFVRVNDDANLPVLPGGPPLLREHRMYQADWLLRYYGFSAGEILTEERPNFNVLLDPKCNWAVGHLDMFPVEVNRADYFELLRVPGIGPKSAGRIVGARRSAVLGFDDLKKLGVVLKRALYFITCSGRMLYPTKIEEDYIVKHLVDALPGKLSEHHDPVTYRQMSLFDVGGLLDPGTGEGICC